MIIIRKCMLIYMNYISNIYNFMLLYNIFNIECNINLVFTYIYDDIYKTFFTYIKHSHIYIFK